MFLAIQLFWSAAWPYLLPIIKIFMGKLGPIIASAAVTAVTTLLTADLTNDEKRAAAFNEVTAALKAKGLEAKESIINLAIEIAVQSLKK